MPASVYTERISNMPRVAVLIASNKAPKYTSTIRLFGFSTSGDTTERKKPSGIKIAAQGAPSRPMGSVSVPANLIIARAHPTILGDVALYQADSTQPATLGEIAVKL
jgi:hypothetical protein